MTDARNPTTETIVDALKAELQILQAEEGALVCTIQRAKKALSLEFKKLAAVNYLLSTYDAEKQEINDA